MVTTWNKFVELEQEKYLGNFFENGNNNVAMLAILQQLAAQ